jgi:predicted neutral ceramidase superfamily lipid hydrolase
VPVKHDANEAKEGFMKALIILAIIVTVAIIFFQYNKNKNLKKLFIALGSFAMIISLAVVGNVTRPVIPIFMAHLILVIMAWGGLMIFLVKERYYWWVIFSPVLTIVLFLLLEALTGSGHEGVLPLP